ncbi:MAG: hypothetical protein OEQ25_10195 [Gammaproteobacteria bacterium]|nr:hypothetical protein [Gammaproteobacteria bacterium]MDH3507496.1 hypothetical protein [Gammaproteobacteria bacterium]
MTSTKAQPLRGFVSSIVSAFGSVRPSERRETLGAFLTLLGFMAGHALLETARDALFLAELPASLLPWVYLTLAASALAIARYRARLARFFRSGVELNGWLALAGISTVALWFAIFWAGDWIFYLLYAWSGILATLIVVQFWILLSERFTVTQAKRLFAVIGTGSVIGAILGSGAARLLTEQLSAQHLVLFAGLVFLVTSLGPLLLGPPPGPPPARRQTTRFTAADVERVSRLVWRRPYLRRVAMAIILATVTFTLVDFVFKSTVARLVPDEQLGEFFATVYLTLNVVSLVVQVAVVSWILRRLTVSVALAIVPALLLLGATAFIALGGLAAVLLLKGIDGGFRYSLYRTTTELLYVPMSAEIRGPVKVFIDVFGQRGGQAIGSLLLLLVLSLTANEAVIAVFAALTAGAWLYLVIQLRPHYLDLFRETLREDINDTKIAFPALDMSSLETLLATLNSPDDRRVIAALDLLVAQGKLRVVPGLILYHPSAEVVIHALELFAAERRDDVLPLIDRLLSDSNEHVRVAGLRVRTTLLPDEYLLNKALTDSSSAMRVTAAVGLVASGTTSMSDAQPHFDEAVRADDSFALLSLARAVGALPCEDFRAVLSELATSENEDVQLAAVRAMRAHIDPANIPVLIGLLTNRALRTAVRNTLVGIGPRALAGVADALADTDLPHAIRRHLPHAIAAFGTPQASRVLLQRLLEEPDGMIRFKLLRGLGRLRRINPQLPLDSRDLEKSIDQNIGAGFRFMRWRLALERVPSELPPALAEHHQTLLELLRDKQAHTVERVFRLLNLQANDEEFLRIYRGLQSPRREAQAGSRELLEHMIETPLRRSILALVDDLYDPSGARDYRDEDSIPSFDRALIELIEGRSESLSSFATYEAGAMRLDYLRPRLLDVTALSPSHAAIIKAAIEMLAVASEARRG